MFEPLISPALASRRENCPTWRGSPLTSAHFIALPLTRYQSSTIESR